MSLFHKVILPMILSNSYSNSCFYTNDHEWITFEGLVAYAGVCPFKFSGIREITKVAFYDLPEMVAQGAVIVVVTADEYQLKIHMPVDGWITDRNYKLAEQPRLIIQPIEKAGWVIKIRPKAPYSREGLLRAEQYKWQRNGVKI